LYGYVLGYPVNLVDPWGLIGIDTIIEFIIPVPLSSGEDEALARMAKELKNRKFRVTKNGIIEIDPRKPKTLCEVENRPRVKQLKEVDLK